MNNIEEFAKKSVQRMRLSQKKGNEVKIEIIDHLHELKQECWNKDINEEQAEQLAFKKLGKTDLMLRWHEKQTFQLISSAIVYIVFYLLTYLFVHHWLAVSRYTEANLIAIVPIAFTSFYFISINQSLDHIGFLYKRLIIPLFVAEKISVPIFAYLMFHRYANHSFRDIAGFTESQYPFLLIKGLVGGIQFYSGYYVLSSVFVLLTVFLLLDKLKSFVSVSFKFVLTVWVNMITTASVMVYGITDNVFGGATNIKLMVIITIYILCNVAMFLIYPKRVSTT
ncbi:hypothetical protein L2089_09625 [Paenibacillus hunanensis]|uniref:hypothetical protein n=1 Tax=Paenibacillus hunanensis TaxID=539262 RepID=UPI0020274362|nr:hypothetical protein [Paenibacillus hunanensis]MCL9660942.1 hypothetical protein [Paenibacillus hunanensis]